MKKNMSDYVWSTRAEDRARRLDTKENNIIKQCEIWKIYKVE